MKIIINGKTAEVSSGGTGSGSSITPQILVNVVDGATVTATKGSTTVTATSTNGVATLNIPSYGEWTITAQKDNSEPASTTVMVDIVKQYQVALKLDIVYIWGVQWDGGPSTLLARTDDASLFIDPIPAVGDGNGSSPFDNLYPWSEIKRVTDSVGELVSIPKYWVKVTHNPFKVQISDHPVEGFQVSPAHRDRGDGQGERNVVYIGRYEGSTNCKSLSGYGPRTNMSRSDFRTTCHALGSEYWQADYALQLTIQYLMLVEFANWDIPSLIGLGNSSKTATGQIGTGGTDSMTYHTGRSIARVSGKDGFNAVQYRHIENLWGNVFEWRDGIVFVDRDIYTYNNPSDFSDTATSVGVVKRGNTRATAGYITNFDSDPDDPSFIFPSEASGGSDESYIPDMSYYTVGTFGMSVSGSYGRGLVCGPFLVNNDQATQGSTLVGSRIQKLPNKEVS